MPFYPLHVSSGHSFLRSALSVKKIVGLALKNNISATAITDRHNLSAYAEFDDLCQKTGITPIFGLDIDLGDEGITCFIRNEVGYLNAIAIDFEISRGNLSIEMVKDHAEGLLIVYDCAYPKLSKMMKDSPGEIPTYLAHFASGFELFYLGLPYELNDRGYVSFLRNFVEKYPHPLVAFPHYLYEKKGDAIAVE
ncbi:MAG: PHP domain-containing protein, partial [Bacilli bacterium]|nr:PHP domain-containing protein [Bacilli bacterium]